MRLLCAILLQLASFGALAGTSSGSLLVTVTVVRPAPVTTTTDTRITPVATTGDTTAEPKTANPVVNTVRYVTVNY